MDIPTADRDRLAARLTGVRAAIADACRAAGRDAGDVRLLPVGKTHPPAALAACIGLGLTEFGENYAQEMAAKAAALPEATRFVFIGALQSNKIRLVVRHAAELQTLADARHARLVAAAAAEVGKTPYPVYIAANAGDESSKAGLPLADAIVFAEMVSRAHPELDVQGLMAIPPPLTRLATADELAAADFVPPLYRQLAGIAAKVGRGRLSLGMSDDLRQAVLAGSTCVRIGTALFGPRA